MTGSLSPVVIGRLAGWLFIGAGLLTAGSLFLPGPPLMSRTAVVIVCAGGVVVGALCQLLPWDRWKPSTSLWLLPIAFALIATGNYYGSSEPYTFGIFFVVTFVWIGLGHPRKTSAWFAPLALIAYVVPIEMRPSTALSSASSAALTIPVAVLVGEAVAWIRHRERKARKRAEALARVSTALGAHLEEADVFQTLVDEAREALDSEHAVLYHIDPDSRMLQRVFLSGLPEPVHSAIVALTGTKVPQGPELQILKRGEPLNVGDTSKPAFMQHELVEMFGIRSYLAVPVMTGDRLVGILTCAESSSPRKYDPDDIALAEAIAVQASVATRNAQLYETARQSARRDPLTGLPNRRAFHERLEAEIERARRHDRTLSLVLLDLDNLKFVNDSWGHQAGDRVLCRLADHLTQTLRASDEAYRIGGDEFALILPETTPAGAATLAERVRRAVERARVGGNAEVRLTVSVGVGSFSEHGASPDELFARADTAMYEVKASGGDAVGMAVASGVRTPGVRFGVDVHEIIEENHLVATYQAIVDLKTGRVAGYECFTHLDPNRGSAPTPTVFRAAGALGMVEVIDRMCRNNGLIGARGLPADQLLFLNVSPAVLEANTFDPDEILRAAAEAGLAPHQIVVEVIEQDRSPESTALAGSLKRCRDAGLKVALDDLGAGSTDLELMACLPFDYVKVDMTFVNGADADEPRRRLLGGLSRLVAETGARSIAEGVETLQDLNLVLDMGFGAAQGFLLGHPATEFEAPDLPDILAGR